MELLRTWPPRASYIWRVVLLVCHSLRTLQRYRLYSRKIRRTAEGSIGHLRGGAWRRYVDAVSLFLTLGPNSAHIADPEVIGALCRRAILHNIRMIHFAFIALSSGGWVDGWGGAKLCALFGQLCFGGAGCDCGSGERRSIPLLRFFRIITYTWGIINARMVF